MMTIMLPLALPLFSLLVRAAQCNDTAKGNINWQPCTDFPGPALCANLSVPLDYTNSDQGANNTLNLELLKLSAVKQPKRGSIIINPGGPGLTGRDFVAGNAAAALMISTGGSYDLIGFDPRGTGNTLPFSCYANLTDRLTSLVDVQTLLNESNTALGNVWAYRGSFADTCRRNASSDGRLLSTTFVARDVMRIVDALDEGPLLNYWGFSYGTALGAILAAEFPDRMGRVVIDGVLNPREYFSGIEGGQLISSDATFAGFFKTCVDNLANCPFTFAQNGTSAEDLLQKTYDLIEKIKFQPITIATEKTYLSFSYTAIKGAILATLYNVKLWPVLAVGLNGLFTGNQTQAAILVATFSASPSDLISDATFGIRCADNALRANNLTDILPNLNYQFNQSKILGDVLSVTTVQCAQWGFQPKERYSGNFSNIATKNPMLVIGNTYDPLTSLANARNFSAGFDGSVVLEHQGYGHTSFGQLSVCTARAVRAYFENGTLPAVGTRCETTYRAFDPEKPDNVTLAPLLTETSKRRLNRRVSEKAVMAATT